MIETEKIRPANWQPRRNFPKEGIDELGQSIKGVGLIEPVIVRKKGNIFEIIAGERRYRAMEQGGFDKIPCIVRADGDTDAKITSLVENWHRAAVETSDNEKFIADLYDEGIKIKKWATLQVMGKITGISYQSLSDILIARREANELSVERKDKLTYTDFKETRPLKESPEARKKLLEKRAEKKFTKDELRTVSTKIAILPTKEQQFEEIDRMLKRKKLAREFEEDGFEKDKEIAEGKRHHEVLFKENKYERFVDDLETTLGKAEAYGIANIETLPKIHYDRSIKLLIKHTAYWLSQLKQLGGQEFIDKVLEKIE